MAFYLTPRNVPVVQLCTHASSKQESKRGERSMSWMTLIVIELLGGVGGAENEDKAIEKDDN